MQWWPGISNAQIASWTEKDRKGISRDQIVVRRKAIREFFRSTKGTCHRCAGQAIGYSLTCDSWKPAHTVFLVLIKRKGKDPAFPSGLCVETVGIEPTSENTILKTSTCVVCLWMSSQVPGRQDSLRLSLKCLADPPQASGSTSPPLSTFQQDLGRRKVSRERVA